MTRSLRLSHRFASVALALALPSAFALALAARPAEPRLHESLAEALAEPNVAAAGASAPLPAAPGAGISFALGSAADGGRVVELDARNAPVAPDALVYWSTGAADSLGPESRLLGALPAGARRAFRAPGTGPGTVVVFSLGWQKVVAAAQVPPETAR